VPDNEFFTNGVRPLVGHCCVGLAWLNSPKAHAGIKLNRKEAVFGLEMLDREQVAHENRN